MRWLPLAVLGLAAALAAQDRPNVLWISCEDIGQDLGCYGSPDAVTPRLDALAARGLVYRNCWSNAPVCAPARTTILMGMYPPLLGAEHMRSLVAMPEGTTPFPELLRDAGYYTSNRSKTDYNVRAGNRVWSESSGKAHWRYRPMRDTVAFFSVFNFTQSHESQIRKRPHEAVHDPAKITLPAKHPDLPEVRQDWAQYHDKITEVDGLAGGILDQLAEDGLADDTIVFFWGDHGSGMPGHKRTPRQTGLLVPLIVHVPEKWREYAGVTEADGAMVDRLVAFVDFAPTVLSLAGIEPPDWMHGRAFLGPHRSPPKQQLFGWRARMDERIDLVRSVRDQRYVYVRNLMPRFAHGQHVAYMFQTPATVAWWNAFEAGSLTPEQAEYWRTPRPAEELYDLGTDPGETRNLAFDPLHRVALLRLRAAWLGFENLDGGDLSLLPESLMHAECGDASPTVLKATSEGRARFARLAAFHSHPERSGEASRTACALALHDADPALQFWALHEIVHEGPVSFREFHDHVVALLASEIAAVRILAAETLGLHGTAAELGRAVTLLCEHADPTHHGWWVAVEAWNALSHLRDRLAAHREQVEAVSIELKDPPGRGNDYLVRLRTHTLGGG